MVDRTQRLHGVVVATWLAAAAGCSQPSPGSDEPLAPGVVFTYPVDNQLDVPLGAHLIVSFSDPIASDAVTGVSVTGPQGNVEITTEVVGGGKTIAIASTALEPATTYAVHVASSASQASRDGAPLFRFTTRSDRPRSGAPTVIAVNGSDPATPGDFRPILETSTLELVFSEPLDPRSVVAEPGSVELVDSAGVAVPFTLIARGIHVAIDPVAPLTPGVGYQIRIGDHVVDLGGQAHAPATIDITPSDSLGRGPTSQVFRTRVDGDPVAKIARTDATNRMELVHPLIGQLVGSVKPATLATELGDPTALGGPIAFTIPRGQRLAMSSLHIDLAGAVPSGLTTGELEIELIADGGGRIYRNRYRPDDTTPDNDRSPLLVDLSLDIAIYATDPTGNAALAATVLGIQLTGLAMADDGALAIETVGALTIELLGLAGAPTNLALDLISDPEATAATDHAEPALLASLPAADTAELVPDQAIELIFDEPVDLDRARAGGVVLRDGDGSAIPTTFELAGSVLVMRPRAALPDGHTYTVELTGVADLAGNAMASSSFTVATPAMAPTTTPATVIAVYPGTACALTAATASTAGRCAGGASGDDRYLPFVLAANEHVDVVFDQPIAAASVSLGAACGTGSVRVERVDAAGACSEAVAGTLEVRRRELVFVPDLPWLVGERYRLRLVSGPDATCNQGELCGMTGGAASFDPLAGTTAGGGPDLVIDFAGAPPTTGTTLFASTTPATDINGSGAVDAGETRRDHNRAALQIAGTSGLITSATFQDGDCMPETPEVENCMYMTGSMPAQLGERRDNCVLPDGSSVASCVPVTLGAQTMLSTSVTMTAAALGIGLTTATGMSVMRVREPVDRPLEAFIVSRDGVPTMVVALDLYMDAPNMTLPLSQHDMHSKPLSVALEGPVSFRDDGRISIELTNSVEVPISVGIQAPLGITGTVGLVVPPRGMNLELMSPPQRGRLP